MIVIAAAGLVSFVGSFSLAWLTKAAPQSEDAKMQQSTFTEQKTDLSLPPPTAGTMSAVGTIDGKMKKAMTERQLKSLIYEIREKVEEYENKLQHFEVREQRLQIAHNLVKKDIEQLGNLRIELAAAVANLKSERDFLLKSRIKIARAEENNLITIAATYDKMDATSASKILTNMSKMQNSSDGSNLDDAVKILHYMGERTKAKLLAELVTSEPKLAAVLCRKLKQIVEEK
jgi:ribosomal protein L18